MRARRWIRYSVLSLAFLVILISAAWLGLQYQWYDDFLPQVRASERALQLWEQRDSSTFVQTEHSLGYQPATENAQTALVIYPGAFCDPRGYLPILERLAQRGYLALVIPMPSDLAMLADDRISTVRKSFPEIKKWALAGHSIGGAAALSLLKSEPLAADGLILLDSYTYGVMPMTQLRLPISSIYGTGHHNPQRPQIFDKAKQYLPEHTHYIAVSGGDHYQFGSFNQDDVDVRATAAISELEAEDQIVTALLAFLKSLESGRPLAADTKIYPSD